MTRRHRLSLRASRRGAALLLVLTLLAITIAMSYAMLRTQGTQSQIHQNRRLRGHAADAAEAGLSLALRQMEQADWSGVQGVLQGTLEPGLTYKVVYTTGDAELSADDDDYSKWPYRVTLTSTGRQVDPADPARSSVHLAEAVVELIPRGLSQPPADWNEINAHTVYQTSTQTCQMELPGRIEGSVRFQGELRFCEGYPSAGAARSDYLQDLARMQLGYGVDWRPLTGPVALPFASQDAAALDALAVELQVPLANAAANPLGPSCPTAPTTYQLYPGGASYDVPLLPANLCCVHYQPDPTTNPLGLFRTNGTVTFHDDVTLQGVILSGSNRTDLRCDGVNIVLAGVDLPPLDGDDQRRQLPLMIANDDVLVGSEAGVTLLGLVYAQDEFEVAEGPLSASVLLQGRLVAGEFTILERWGVGDIDWEALHTQFETFYQSLPDSWRLFPIYTWVFTGYDPQPRTAIWPDNEVQYHWPDWTAPIFQPADGDAGLKWKIIHWRREVER